MNLVSGRTVGVLRVLLPRIPRGTVVLAQSAADRAHLCSHSGPAASEVAPTSPEFTMVPSLLRTAILERLRLPLDVTDATCTCGGRLDSLGRHRGACPQSGRLHTRAIGPERTVARICREAGAVVRTNMKLRDMNIVCPANDDREIEVVASGLRLRHGAQLTVDVTLRSATTSCGAVCTNAANMDGAVLFRVRRDKETKHAELVGGARCHLVVVAIETGGRWSDESMNFISDLASDRSRNVPQALQRQAFLAWRRRWTRTLAVSCCRAFSSSLILAGVAFRWCAWHHTRFGRFV